MEARLQKEIDAMYEDIENCTCWCKPERCKDEVEAIRVAKYRNMRVLCGCNWEAKIINHEWIAIPDLKHPLQKNKKCLNQLITSN